MPKCGKELLLLGGQILCNGKRWIFGWFRNEFGRKERGIEKWITLLLEELMYTRLQCDFFIFNVFPGKNHGHRCTLIFLNKFSIHFSGFIVSLWYCEAIYWKQRDPNPKVIPIECGNTISSKSRKSITIVLLSRIRSDREKLCHLKTWRNFFWKRRPSHFYSGSNNRPKGEYLT